MQGVKESDFFPRRMKPSIYDVGNKENQSKIWESNYNNCNNLNNDNN